MKLTCRAFIIGVWLLSSVQYCWSQTGIRGMVSNTDGTPLPWATVYVEELKMGTITNLQGIFEFPAPAGEYTLNFRHLGYRSESRKLSVTQGFSEVNVQLGTQAVVLPVVAITSSTEDPAYAIMRKAIAAARYYRMLVKGYEATIYIKGSGEVRIPRLFRALAGQQPLDSVEYFLSETVSRNQYEYPNTYRQEVLSARSNDKDSGQVVVNRFVSGNIYEPLFADVVSPLSPAAFGFYRFRLKNSFTDGPYEIHQIAVVPRSRGAKIFEGDIFIIDGLWAVYSFALKTWAQGFDIHIHQVFAAVNEKVWFPVSHRYDVEGKILGVGLKFQYLASLSDYLVTINDTLAFDRLVLIDEKTEQEFARALADEKARQAAPADSALNAAHLPQKFTLKDFRKVMKDMEKESKKRAKEPDIILDYSQKIDSMAFSRNPAFWDSLRPIPLTAAEKRPGLGRKIDSVEALRQSDTARAGQKLGRTAGFILTGGSRSMNKSWRFESDSPLEQLNFNTVEGLTLTLPVRFVRRENDRLEAGADIRYGFGSREWLGQGILNYRFGYKSWKINRLGIKGGRYLFQFNPGNPVHPFLNTFYSLLWMDNYLKLYAKNYLSAQAAIQLTDRLILSSEVEWARRELPENVTDYTWAARKGREYTPNAPVNNEMADTRFAPHTAFLVRSGVIWKPAMKFTRENGILRPARRSYPVLSLDYSGALKGILGGEVNWHRLETGIHHLHTGPRGEFELKIHSGHTFRNGEIPFTDFRHFNGNLTFITLKGPMDAYRLLDYYQYSTRDTWAGAFCSVRMNRFLLSRIFWLNIMGIRESLNLNYLRTSHSPNYWEAGYGIENLLQILKLEVFTAWEDNRYQAFGIRLGISLGSGGVVVVD